MRFSTGLPPSIRISIAMLLYVEQPFPYELEDYPIDVRSVAARKPLFMDESAHDWQQVRLGRALGWTGVALKTCKTQTGRTSVALLGESPRHAVDGAGPHQSDARADSARAARRTRRHDHGRRNQRDAVLSAGVGRRGQVSSRPVSPRRRTCRSLDASADRASATTAPKRRASCRAPAASQRLGNSDQWSALARWLKCRVLTFDGIGQ